MRDVVFALSTAERYNHAMSKIHLQKFIYLLDIVAFFYKHLPPKRSYETYFNGPFDKEIQNAADSLVFRGLVICTKVRAISNNAKQAEYELSDAGREWVIELSSMKDFETRYKAAEEVAKQVSAIGWNRLVKLVYAEPTFVNNSPNGFGQSIDITNGLESSAAFLLQTIEQSLKRGDEEIEISRELVTDLFFRFLDNYSRRNSKDNTGEGSNDINENGEAS